MAGPDWAARWSLLFAAEGATVIVADIDADAGERTVTEIGDAAEFVPGDVADDDAMAGVFCTSARRTAAWM